jgi:hypothetical protein
LVSRHEGWEKRHWPNFRRRISEYDASKSRERRQITWMTACPERTHLLFDFDGDGRGGHALVMLPMLLAAQATVAPPLALKAG